MAASARNMTIRNAGTHELSRITNIMADAFKRDPVMTWISDRFEYPEYAFARSLPLFLQQGETYVTEDGSSAAAWVPPGSRVDLPVTFATFWHALTHYGIWSVGRMYKVARTMTKHHPKEKHFYLFALGVVSKMQGKGIGSVIIQHVLKRCDQDHVAAYLENTNARNLPFYKRHGFRVLRELPLSSGGVRMWAMWREPL